MNRANTGDVQPGDTTYCNFEVGQHVVCVKEDDMPDGLEIIDPLFLPTVGKIYTVRCLELGDISKELCLKFEEIPDQDGVRFTWHNVTYSGSVLYPARNFRPLQKLKVEDFLVAETPVDSVPA
jgi:hypothetical protein